MPTVQVKIVHAEADAEAEAEAAIDLAIEQRLCSCGVDEFWPNRPPFIISPSILDVVGPCQTFHVGTRLRQKTQQNEEIREEHGITPYTSS